MQSTELKPKNVGQKQLFQSPILEALTRTHIAVPITLFCGVSAWLFYQGVQRQEVSVFVLTSMFVLGLLFFTWIEYNIHRFLFHIPATSEGRKKFQYTIHGVHHEYPKDKGRLAMPPAASILLCLVFYWLYWSIIGEYMFGFMPGFLVGYCAYLWVHYSVHAFRPPANVLKYLWINHGIHHYRDGDCAYGVSSPLWDYIYGTMPKK